jgi:hypothetical protein
MIELVFTPYYTYLTFFISWMCSLLDTAKFSPNILVKNDLLSVTI